MSSLAKRGRRFARIMPAAAAVALMAAMAPTAPAATSTLTTGFLDQAEFASPLPSTRSDWFGRARAVNASTARIDLYWAQVAPPTRPAGFDPSNPASPGYNWTAIDRAVRDATAHGLNVLLTMLQAPAWAEGPGRPAGAPSGTWRPDVQQVAAFSRAAALRYSGEFPDPLQPGAVLPRVSYWQGWNEPNLSVYLTPQWTNDSHGRLQPSSPAIYRAILNSFYAAVKGVHADNLVVEAGTAPYGDPNPGGQRLFPALFVRLLLCLGAHNLKPAPCANPVHFDVLAHHPYAIAGPYQHGLNPDDVTIPDLSKLTRPLASALRSGRVLPRVKKPVWVTEFSWDSGPPDPHGVPIATHARWLQEALEVFWRAGVSKAIWLNVLDQAPIPDYATTYQSGVYFLDGTLKPAATAFAFPFVVHRRSATKASVWGVAPQAGTLTIERQTTTGWAPIRSLHVASPAAVFQSRFRARGGTTYRARDGAAVSLPWTLGR